MLGWRVRDLSLGYNPFLLGKGIAQYYSDPVFNALPDPPNNTTVRTPISLSLLKSIISLNTRIPGGFWNNLQSKYAMNSVRKFTNIFNNPGMNWDDIALIREWTQLPIYLKGIIRPDDAVKAVAAGVDGIIISNHGGRQIDGSVSTAESLPGIYKVVKDRLEIWIDSGIRTGSDVFKCIALGATGVLIGRPYAYSLAINGTAGVKDCIDNIMAELELIMTLSGCHTLSDINDDMVSHPW
jgi:lactate 2-monooxygenase